MKVKELCGSVPFGCGQLWRGKRLVDAHGRAFHSPEGSRPHQVLVYIGLARIAAGSEFCGYPL